jgi:hypothetical protein
LGPTVVKLETRRIADPRIGDGMADQHDLAAAAQQRPHGRIRSGRRGAKQQQLTSSA